MSFTSQLATNESVLASEMGLAALPTFGEEKVLTAFNTLSITQDQASVSKLFGSYTASTSIQFRTTDVVQGSTLLSLIDRFLLNAQTLDVYGDIDGDDRTVVRYLRRQQDGGVFPTNGSAMSALQTQPVYDGTATAGSYDIIMLNEFGFRIVATIDYDDDVAAIQTKLDTAADLVLIDYFPGDIEVSQPVSDIRFSFVGNSVRYTHWDLMQIDETNLTGDGSFPEASHVVYGHPARYGWSLLHHLEVVETPPTEDGSVPASFNVNPAGSRYDYPPQYVIRALAEEMVYVENDETLRTKLFQELGISRV